MPPTDIVKIQVMFAAIIGAILLIPLFIVMCVYRNWIIWHTAPPEIRRIDNKEELFRVHQSGMKEFRSSGNSRPILFRVTLLPLLLGIACMMLTRNGPWQSHGIWLGALLCGLLPFLLGIPLSYSRYYKWMTIYVRQYLNDHEMPICMNCGYDLRGLTHARCPECGVESETNSPA